MSRSYREPWVVDGYKGSKRKQFFKRRSNKVLRKAENIPNGRAFKKFTDTWDICDFRWYQTKESMEKWNLDSWKYNRK